MIYFFQIIALQEGNEGRGVEVFKPLNIKKKPTGRLTEDESQKQVQVER